MKARNTAKSRNMTDALVDALAPVDTILFDIDDTFTSHGKIGPAAFAALWKLQKAGYRLIPVTGRPAGWCDHIARMWPVDGVIGENGAFFQYRKGGKLHKKYFLKASERKVNRLRLEQLERDIRSRFPEARWASDQAFREFDIAVDFCEDVAPWKPQRVDQLLKFCRSRGAVAKLSSIHVNTWYGDYDKWSCASWVLTSHFKIPVKRAKGLARLAYLGDSPNDEPFFAQVPLSVGVANIRPFLKRLKHRPRFLMTQEAGEGFAEFAAACLSLKGDLA